MPTDMAQSIPPTTASDARTVSWVKDLTRKLRRPVRFIEDRLTNMAGGDAEDEECSQGREDPHNGQNEWFGRSRRKKCQCTGCANKEQKNNSHDICCVGRNPQRIDQIHISVLLLTI